MSTAAPPLLDRAPAETEFLADVLRGLRAPVKELPCKYFYDEAGSRLFERITRLPEYYPTRTELSIMRRHAGEMAELAGPRAQVIEFGSGTSEKTRLLLDRLPEPAGYVPVDICAAQLDEAARRLAAEYPGLDVMPVCADFTRPFELPAPPCPAVRRVVYFPGSTVGNFMPDEAVRLLRRVRRLCGASGGMILGADLKKDPAALHAAYNDRDGVTAAFNRNLLVRINRELGADFAVERFFHYAYYDPRAGRVEMHLVSDGAQRVRLAGEELAFDHGESVRTECSHKYSGADLRRLADAGGFTLRETWTDSRQRFCVLYLAVQ